MNFNYKALFPDTENIELLNHQIVTKRDLLNFGNLLLREIKNTNKKNKSSSELPKPCHIERSRDTYEVGTRFCYCC